MSASSARLFSRLTGTGSALPSRAVSNDELAAQLALRGIETSDDWIVSRTGIRQRYLAAPGQGTADLAEAAARAALAAAGRCADEVDLIVLATSTPDQMFPSTACLVQARLRILDWDDRTTCVLFGDGAGAVVLEAGCEPGVLAARLHADGRQAGILCTAGRVERGGVVGDPFLRMDGQAVFKLAVSVLESSAREVLADAGMTADQVDWLIPHQANARILAATVRKLGLPEERLVATVDCHGNTSAASVPLALDLAVRDGRIRPGQHVVLQGVGGGFTWGSVLLRM